MEHDVLPDLLARVQADFERSVAKSEVLREATAALRGKSATYEDVNRYAVEVGEALAESLGRLVTAESLPDGKMYYNIAERLLSGVLGRNHELISSYAADVQTLLNQEAKIGLKAQVPDFNRDRVDGLVNRLASEDDFEAVSWLLQEPIVNFSQSIVDESIRVNAEFHAKAGLSPKIVRRSAGHCCDWCQAVVGTYSYPDVPKDVYRRHQRCRCIVDYDPKTGKIQNVHSKRWRDGQESDKIRVRKALNLPKEFDTRFYAHNPDGTLKVSRVVRHSLPKDAKPFEVIDLETDKGIASRTLYNGSAKRGMRIDASDHGQPKYHPMGAHKHIIEYDQDGNYLSEGEVKLLSAKDREENKDIL